MKAFLSLVVALGLTLGCAAGAWAQTSTPAEPPAPAQPTLDSGSTAWMLMSTALVMLMVPGLALFYGGMVRRKNILGTMMHSMVALGIIGIQWVVYGYALSFGDSHNGLIGWSSKLLCLDGVLSDEIFPGTGIPIFVHCMYQGMFAIITPALISGAFAERIRFGPYCLFTLLWATLVYDPLAHWVWAVDGGGKAAGWLGKMGALDFAGGTVVHIAAGVSGLAAILVLRKRRGYPEHAMHPNSMVLTLLGAGLLWFGWFGFNGGSALGASGLAGAALTATQVAAAAAALSWMLVEWSHRGKPTALGFASGLVAGLVAVTPASGYVTPGGALCIGALAGMVCYAVVALKPVFKYDDSLDAFGVHGVGGALGAILTGVFASVLLWQKGAGSTDPLGALEDGRFAQIKAQALAVLAAAAFAFGMTFLLIKAIDLVWGFCLDDRAEHDGLDRAEHGEVGFDFSAATQELAESHQQPRPAHRPPNGQGHFTVVIDGGEPDELLQAWSGLCQSGPTPAPAELRELYPFVTTVQGNRFRFRGGDPAQLSVSLERLLESRLPGTKVRARVET